MKEKKKGYKPLLILTAIFTLAGILTLIPSPGASHACALGYKALCSFTPWGTLICFGMSMITCIIRSRFFVIRK